MTALRFLSINIKPRMNDVLLPLSVVQVNEDWWVLLMKIVYYFYQLERTLARKPSVETGQLVWILYKDSLTWSWKWWDACPLYMRIRAYFYWAAIVWASPPFYDNFFHNINHLTTSSGKTWTVLAVETFLIQRDCCAWALNWLSCCLTVCLLYSVTSFHHQSRLHV